MVDAPASGAGVRMDVEVRVLSWAPNSHTILELRHAAGFRRRRSSHRPFSKTYTSAGLHLRNDDMDS